MDDAMRLRGLVSESMFEYYGNRNPVQLWCKYLTISAAFELLRKSRRLLHFQSVFKIFHIRIKIGPYCVPVVFRIESMWRWKRMQCDEDKKRISRVFRRSSLRLSPPQIWIGILLIWILKNNIYTYIGSSKQCQRTIKWKKVKTNHSR